MKFENKLALGTGIYTAPTIASILQLPNNKVNYWLKKYLEGRLGKTHNGSYSWSNDKTRAVSFLSFVELYVVMQFAEAGVKSAAILRAHEELSKNLKTTFPLAHKKVIENIGAGSKKIYINTSSSKITLESANQFNLGFVKNFFKKIDFDEKLLAAKLWPLGKNKAVVCDPHHKFGHPVVEGTNIQTDALYSMYLAKEPIAFIARLYELPEKKVKDAISFHKRVA